MFGSTTRLTGLTTGMDTAAMIKQIMRAESIKMDRLRQKRQVTEWRQHAYRDTAAVLRDFQTNMLSLTSLQNSIRLPGNFNTLRAGATSNGIETTAIRTRLTDSSAVGSFSFKVIQTAEKDAYAGATIQMRINGGTTDTDFSDTALLNKTMIVSLDGGREAEIRFTSDLFTLGVLDTDKVNDMLRSRFGVTASDPGAAKISMSLAPGGPLTIFAGPGHTVKILGGTALKDTGIAAGSVTEFNELMLMSSLMPPGYFDGGNDPVTITLNGRSFTVNSTDTLAGFMKTINESGIGVTVSYDKLRARLKIESNETGAANAIDFTGSAAFFSALSGGDVSRISTARDALIEYNGVVLARNENEFALNNVLITLTENVTANQIFEVNVTRDITQTFDLIKNFVDEYNKLIDAINKQVTTPRPMSDKYSYYMPLTDEQKNAMKDREIEQWDEKAKTGMLHRDDILSSLLREMRSMVYAPVSYKDADGNEKKVALFHIGITTSSEDKYVGKLQIDELALRRAIENNPDAVKTLFTKDSEMSGVTVSDRKRRLHDQGIGDRLNDIIRNAIEFGGSIYDRAGIERTSSFSNNALQRQLAMQDSRINDMLKYLIKREDFLFRTFARMEDAMSKANTQMGALYSMIQ
ncbi:MAG: flagellar filament capping protein FliD [Defluviitaleaceae bacterium]|nr:flagellar filament capping protein FliD [Defluviitaleaceae bacterium]